MQPRGLGALLWVAGKPVSPSMVGEGVGFFFLFLEVPLHPPWSLRAAERTVRKGYRAPGRTPPLALRPGRQKAPPRGAPCTQEEAR